MAFADFLEPARGPSPSSRVEGARLSFRGASPQRNIFDLRKAKAERGSGAAASGDGSDAATASFSAESAPSPALSAPGREDPRGSNSSSSSGSGGGGGNSGPPPRHNSREISPQSVLDMGKRSPFHPSRAPLPTTSGNGSGNNSGTLKPISSFPASNSSSRNASGEVRPLPPSGAAAAAAAAAVAAAAAAASASAGGRSSAASSLAASPALSPAHEVMSAVPRKLVKGFDASSQNLQHSFEMRKSGSSFGGGSGVSCGGGSGSHDPSPKHELFAASGAEDLANDEALGAFLNKANAAARTRRRQAAESTSYSEQFLNAAPTRRGRRMSSDSAVCEMRPHVDALRGDDALAKRLAAKAVRMALKDGPENRMRLVGAGGVLPLALALRCNDSETVEHATAALLHLSLSFDSAVEVMSAGGLRGLVEVLDPAASSRATEAAQSNAAACLFALSQNEENRRLVYSSGALAHLASLQKRASTTRAKKDSCLALFNLALTPKGPEDMVREGVVERTVELLEEAEEGVEEKAAALLGGLAKTDAGVEAIKEVEEDALYALADTLEGGTSSAAEHAATALHYLCKRFPDVIPKILAEGCLPPLVRLASQSKKTADSRALLLVLRDYCAKKAKAEAEARDRMQLQRKAMSLTRSPSPLRPMHSASASISASPDVGLSTLSLDRASGAANRAWSGDQIRAADIESS